MAKVPEAVSRSCVCVILVAALALDAGRREAGAQGTGTILMSSSADSQCGLATVIRVRVAARLPLLKGQFITNGLMTKSAFPDRYGNVHALTIEPGEYFFELAPLSGLHHYRDGRLSNIRIAAGEVKYVGDVGIQGCGNVRTTVANKWSQVRGKFAETHPNLNLRSVKIELITRPPTAAN